MEFTKAEKEIIPLLCVGSTNQQMASRRGVSLHTIHNQMSKLFLKTRAKSRTHLCAMLVQAGIAQR